MTSSAETGQTLTRDVRGAATAAALSLVASATQRGAALAALYLLSIWTDAATVAAFGFWYTIAITVQAIGTGTVSMTLSRYLPPLIATNRQADAGALALHCLRPLAAITAAALLVVGLFHTSMGSGVVSGDQAVWMLGLTALVILVLAVRGFLETLLVAASHFPFLAGFGFASGLLHILAIASFGIGYGPLGALAGFLLASLVDTALLAIKSRWIFEQRYDALYALPHDYRQYLSKIFVTNLVSAPVNWICLVVVSRATGDVGAIALTHFVNQWFNVTLFFSFGISRALLPAISRINDLGRQVRLTLAVSALLAVLAIPALALGYMLSPHLLALAQQDFPASAHQYLNLAFWSGAFNVVSIPFGMWMLARGHSSLALLSNASWLVVFGLALAAASGLPILDRVFGGRTAAYLWLLGYNSVVFVILALRQTAGRTPAREAGPSGS